MAEKTVAILKEVKRKKVITERQIQLLTRRKNNGEKFDESMF